MQIINVPAATEAKPRISAGEITFVDYQDKGGPFRNSVLFERYAFSFVQNGQKRIYRSSGSTILSNGQGMLIAEGNSIIAEHSDNSGLYHSVIVFFPGSLGREFISSRHGKLSGERPEAPYIHFKTNAYINEFVRHIRTLIACGQRLSSELAVLKVRELLTAMYEMVPGQLTAMFSEGGNLSLKGVVEHNLLNPLSLEELAFLANRSLSSFKRDFMQAYGVSPQRYIRERRLEMACAELVRGRAANELYLDYGYQHLSNFNTAFKRKYGVTPSDYRGAK